MDYQKLTMILNISPHWLNQSAGALEYTDRASAEG